ncbi:hypothetical protein PSQ40_20600 [Curvibacter sp. HBC61]|uniref:Glycosyltransferase RgtA/B/C/D-like domain-containing protein n=1 Tax=Curvibacter cyanobacteriorum TaxID=3026422 RepID=A0ABT5N3V0_9BURK|nr:hypothetical protein [Curvibacter sp. HBC61]MDD0840989.1 hypothetical protein [Curvibacter sp. HBC61]
MTDALSFAAGQYATLAWLLLAFWGLGQTLFKQVLRVRGTDPWLQWALACSSGMGLTALALQALGVAGLLRRGPLNGVLLTGLLLAIWQLWQLWQLGREARGRRQRAQPQPQPQADGPSAPGSAWLRAACALLALGLLVPTWVAPLSPPFEWDEMMYHLPHARQWVENGRLSVNEWLRYPWFPYNYNLLYAAGLILRGDQFTHLLHALAGWLTTLMVYRLGLRHAGPLTALGGTAIWVGMNLWFFSNAYVDLGVALFVTGAGAACLLWLEDPKAGRGWLLVSAFLMGVAVGAKYQSLFFLPLYLAVLLWRDRRPATLALATAVLLLPSLYWYVRNAVLTGDPFSPLGGQVFGFHDWNARDHWLQFQDLKRVANWPEFPLWPLLLTPLLRPWRSGLAWACAAAFSAYALVSWYVTSHYDRYLVPSMPVLALLSAWTCVELLRRGSHVLARRWPAITPARRRGGLWVALALAAALVVNYARQEWHHYAWRVSPTQAQRDQFLRQQIVAYDLLQHLRTLPGLKIYQWGLEDAIYYAPNPIWGEVFGPWRQADLVDLSAPELAAHLHRQGFNTLLVRDNVLERLQQLPGFEQHFTLLSDGKGGQAFQILPP